MASLTAPISTTHSRLLLSLLFAFVFSRLVIFGISLAGYHHFQREFPDLSWDTLVKTLWFRFDVCWYTRIAHQGYEALPFSTEATRGWGFLPLYPMVLKAFSWLFPIKKFGFIAAFVSSLSAFSALFILSNTFKHRIQNLNRFLFLYLVSAGSFYLSIPYAESLGLFLLACTFHFTQKNRYCLAALMAGLGAITRLQLVALVLIPLIALLRDPEAKGKPVRALALSALFSLPSLAHMAYLNSLTGDPFAFLHIQAAWGNPSPYPLEALVVFIQNGLKNPPWQWLQFLTWALFGACLVRNYKNIPLNELVFCAVVFLISTGSEQFYGTYRYVLMLIPLYIALTHEEEWFRNLYTYSNLIAGTIYILAFTNNCIFSL